MKESFHKRIHTIWFYLYEIPETAKTDPRFFKDSEQGFLEWSGGGQAAGARDDWKEAWDKLVRC